jgi:hypothetical protein
MPLAPKQTDDDVPPELHFMYAIRAHTAEAEQKAARRREQPAAARKHEGCEQADLARGAQGQ